MPFLQAGTALRVTVGPGREAGHPEASFCSVVPGENSDPGCVSDDGLWGDVTSWGGAGRGAVSVKAALLGQKS